MLRVKSACLVRDHLITMVGHAMLCRNLFRVNILWAQAGSGLVYSLLREHILKPGGCRNRWRTQLGQDRGGGR